MTVDAATTQATSEFFSSGSHVDIFFCGSDHLVRDVPSNLQDVCSVASGSSIAMPLSLSALGASLDQTPSALTPMRTSPTNFRPNNG